MAVALVQHQGRGLSFELGGKRTSLLAHQTPLSRRGFSPKSVSGISRPLHGDGKGQIKIDKADTATPEISGTLGRSSGKGIAGAVITVKRDDKGVWTCGITGSPTNWKANYAPANCPKS
ncbi:pilin [Pseudomonas aeruginosa]|uniref:pilin n=1 Tax=Pseudomonas aeruginosa TaxID=287 RepID=UPI000B8B7F97|nr:pilin [Pseudomonas aeruginosa]